MYAHCTCTRAVILIFSMGRQAECWLYLHLTCCPDAAWGKKRCPHHCPGDARRSPNKMLQHLPFASQILVALQAHQIVGCTGPLLPFLQLVATFPKSSRLRSVGVHFGSTWNEPDNNCQLKTHLVWCCCRKEDDTV